MSNPGWIHSFGSSSNIPLRSRGITRSYHGLIVDRPDLLRSVPDRGNRCCCCRHRCRICHCCCYCYALHFCCWCFYYCICLCRWCIRFPHANGYCAFIHRLVSACPTCDQSLFASWPWYRWELLLRLQCAVSLF